MNVDSHSTAPCDLCKTEMVVVRRSDLDYVMADLVTLMELAPRRFREDVWELDRAIGRAKGRLGCILREAMTHVPAEPPLSLYQPTHIGDDRGPDPAELAWAAENLTPTAPPRDPAALLRYLVDAMEAIGLEPTIADGPRPLSIGLMAWNREYGLVLEDRTAFYEHMDRASREYDQEQAERRNGLSVACGYEV